jgi:hypothetical protein
MSVWFSPEDILEGDEGGYRLPRGVLRPHPPCGSEGILSLDLGGDMLPVRRNTPGLQMDNLQE